MRKATGTLADLTAALNDALVEMSAPIAPATGTLASATSQLNALLVWANSGLMPADGTLPSAVTQYNQLVTISGTARSVDRIDFTNIVDTGLTTAIKRYTFSLEFWWKDSRGMAHHYGPTTHTWPNDLSTVPDRRMRQWAIELVIQAIRWRLGVDTSPEA